MTFLDTSAIYALADRADPNYQAAERCFRALVEAGEEILTHNYVLVESFALLHHRLGLTAALRLAESCRAFVVKWIDRDLHNEAIAELARTRRRAVSLVDQVSFLVMREGGVQEALAFDQDFVRAGFRLVR